MDDETDPLMGKIREHATVINYLWRHYSSASADALSKGQLGAMIEEIGELSSSIIECTGTVDVERHMDDATGILIENRGGPYGLDARYELYADLPNDEKGRAEE